MAHTLPSLNAMASLNISSVVFIILLILFCFICRFTYFYVRARSQFPGPPIKNFWIGNLDQTMADNVDKKVCYTACPARLYANKNTVVAVES